MDPQRWKQIDELLDAVFDLEPSDRSEFLNKACNGDETLKKEVERLLASDHRAKSFIEAPVLHPDGKFVVKNTTESSVINSKSIPPLFSSETKESIQLGSIIAGRYEIRSRLGEGGMGEVWRAYDLKLRVDVALKSLRFDFKGDPLEFLRREVRIAREVISPNVCRIFDLVSEEDYELISMEHIDGITLMQMIEKNGPLPLRDARDIAAQFLAGLDAIHTAGLVHRDLKPENIMITRTGRVVVMDLGIAQPKAHAGGTISGTPAYMSPEQKAGEPVDARSDIYSAGVVLAEMIHTKGTQSHNTREMIWKAISEDPLQLPESAWKEVIARAVAQKKEDRFESAVALSHALEEHTLRTETIEDRTPYPGLASFSSDDSEFFFGREQEVESLIKKIQQLHLMALIGPSGAGKTSFIQAGLIPSLPKDWNFVLFHPGGAPVANLQQSIALMLSGDEEASERMINFEEPDTAMWVLSRVRQAYTEFVLIVDRFEELFTLSSYEVQSRFVEFLSRATLETDVRILLVMRDDFFIFCNQFPALSPIFSEVSPMLPLSGAALRRALVQPALKCGYRFEDESLVHDILSDVEKERGALPLLAFAASLLWEKRDRVKGQLTRKAYQEIGEVRGALAQHAENTMQKLGVEKESIVREIFRNLITAQNTRVARDPDDLLSVFEKESQTTAKAVLRVFIDSRLLTSSENRIEITHESLITNWPRLVKWRAQDAESAQMRDELRQAAQLWHQKKRPVDLLWTGAAFMEFQIWRERYPGGLSATENAFAEAMAQHASKKRRQRRIVVSTIIIVLLAIIMVIANFWRSSVTEAKLAQASKLLVLGRSLPQADSKTKLAYAIASLNIVDTVDARRFAIQVLSDGPPPFVLTDKLDVLTFFSPDNKWLAAITGAELLLFPQDGSAPILVTKDIDAMTAQFTRDSKFLVWVSTKNARNIQIWSVAEKKIVRNISMSGYTKILNSTNNGVYFYTDTTGAIKTSFRNTVPWTDSDLSVLQSAQSELKMLGHWNMTGVGRKVMAPGGNGIAYRKESGIYYRSLNYSGLGPETLLANIDENSMVSGLAFHPDGKSIAVSQNADTRIYAIDPLSTAPMRILPATGEVVFDWKGRYVAILSDNRILRWDLLSNDAEPVVIQHPLGQTVDSLSFDQQDNWMVVSWENSAEFYSLKQIPFIFKRNAGGSSYIRFTPDGKSIIDGFDNEGLRIWSFPGATQTPARILWKSDVTFGYSMYFDLDPSGKHIILSTNRGFEGQPYFISVDDGKAVSLKNKFPNRPDHSFSFSPDGKYVASVCLYEGFLGVEIRNLQTGEVRVIEKTKDKGSLCVKYAPDGSLFSGDTSGNLYHWNLKDDTCKVWKIGEGIVTSIAITNDGKRVAAIALSAKQWVDLAASTSEFTVLDLKENKLNRIASHGNRLFRVAFDPSGTDMVTGDIDGLVRVGKITGEAPHLLYGHQNHIGDVAFDPSGQWIASTEMNRAVVRLWPMPQGESLQVLPYDELIRRLRNLTNVRVVPDKNSSSGFQIHLERFPGW